MRLHAGGWVWSVALGTSLVASTPMPSQSPGERGSFVATRGRDTTTIERFSRVGDRLEAELIAPRTPWLSYRLDGGPAAERRTFELTIRAPFSPRDTTPSELRRLVFAGDSANETRTRDGTTTVRQRYTGAAGLPMLYPSLALLEMVTRRARQMGASVAPIPVIEVGYRERQFLVTLAWVGTDSARLDVGGTEFRLAVDPEGRVLGGRVPSLQITITRQAGWVDLAAPAYTAPPGAPYTAEDVRVATAENRWLAATLTRPKAGTGRVPVAITIPGSGQLDRDGTPDGLPGYQPFREMAEALAGRGVALLRYDKRGVGGSSPAQGTTSEAVADDLRAILRVLRSREDVAADCVTLIGHSEGGIIAPMIAAEASEGIRAVVLIAAPAWRGREVLRSQIRGDLAANPRLSDAQRDSMAAQRLARVEAGAAAGSWMRFFLDYDPLPTARRVRVPVLILQGQTDQHVTPEQAGLLADALREAGNARVTVHLLPKVNHFLLDDPDGRTRVFDLPSRRINTQALRLLTDWVSEQGCR